MEVVFIFIHRVGGKRMCADVVGASRLTIAAVLFGRVAIQDFRTFFPCQYNHYWEVAPLGITISLIAAVTFVQRPLV